jgi:hypothetical protein
MTLANESESYKIGDPCNQPQRGIVTQRNLSDCPYLWEAKFNSNDIKNIRKEERKILNSILEKSMINHDENGRKIREFACCPLEKYEIACQKLRESIKYDHKNRVKRIFRGDKAADGEFPHFAALAKITERKLDFVCGGALISSKFIVTAAHCLKSKDEPLIIARLGSVNFDSGDFQDYDVIHRIQHPLYNPSIKEYDVALVKLKGEIQFTNKIFPACIARPKYEFVKFNTSKNNYRRLKVGNNDIFTISGYGKQDPKCKI